MASATASVAADRLEYGKTLKLLPLVVDASETKKPSFQVERLAYEHCKKAVAPVIDAFIDNPVVNYIQKISDSKPSSPFVQVLLRVQRYLYLLYIIRTRIAYTINGGDSIIVAVPAHLSVLRSPLRSRIVNGIIAAICGHFSNLLATKQQKKRRSEFREACEKLKASNLGDRTKSMIYIQLLCTAPEKQRRGYGSALVNTVAAMGDTDTVGYLICSNDRVVPFYEKLEPPVRITLMVRELKAKRKEQAISEMTT